LVNPLKILVSANLLFVLENLEQQIRAFDAQTGDWLWTFGRKGEGPGEMLQAYGLFIDSSERLKIWDERNRKLLTVDRQGSLVGEEYFRDLWGLSSMPTGFGDRLIWMQLSPRRPAYISGFAAEELLDSVAFDWPIPDDLPYRPNLFTETAGAEGFWVQALRSGPYFAVGDSDGVSVHPYVVPIPYGYSPGQRVWAVEPTADSARFGALNVAAIRGQIFVLSGGRPRMSAHPEEPNRYIDVYRQSGSYSHSFFLPSDTRAITTEDGTTFFALTELDEGFPQILRLRARSR
jgi:hypothetical protein